MTTIFFGGTAYECQPGESVLECLERNGQQLPSLCRSGTCRVCQQRCITDELPGAATFGLRETAIADGGFLPCVCEPVADIEVRQPAAPVVATVVEKSELAPATVRIRLTPESEYDYRAGQHLTVHHPAGASRPYSLASIPTDGYLELHVQVIADGEVSPWIANDVQVGEQLLVGSAQGESFYLPGDPEQPLLLVGVGTGLAPLYGILRDALNHKHRAPIVVVHAGETSEGLYYEHELHSIAARHRHVAYAPVVGAPTTAWRDHVPDPSEWRVFLSGAPRAVQATRKAVFAAGATMRNLYVDPFTPTARAAASAS
ncbi:MAG: 2Fe-2S iron-sulfur cluster binding domain-containing protein [Planctomycetota bacterium]